MIQHDNTFGTSRGRRLSAGLYRQRAVLQPGTFRVIDYIGGVADLEARLIRTIGDPELRMREDPVRMIRAVRFAAKLGFEIEAATRAAIEHHREDLKASVRGWSRRFTARSARRRSRAGPDGAARAARVLIPRLSAHLRARGHASRSPPCETSRRSDARSAAEPPTLSSLPACSSTSAARRTNVRAARDGDGGLLGELRGQGFARGDTEHMRLLIDAFELFHARARRARRLTRRPYFSGGDQLFFADYGDDRLARFDALMASSRIPRPSARSAGARRCRRADAGRRRRPAAGAAGASAAADGVAVGAPATAPPRTAGRHPSRAPAWRRARARRHCRDARAATSGASRTHRLTTRLRVLSTHLCG